jgi:hypothetical protein
LIEADAQSLALPATGADAVFSRFGVMGFSDPVAAFANFRRLVQPSGRLAFCCWRSLVENQLDYLPLIAAGFSEVTIEPYDAWVSSGDLGAMTSVLLKVGPLGKIGIRQPWDAA